MKKKLLVIAPHEDDEINIAGGVIYSVKEKYDTYILFTTNGDFLFDAKYRYKEAIKSLNYLKVNKKNIFFMGYSDQAYDQTSHMYNSEDNWISKKGIIETYGALNIEEWNYKTKKKHCTFNRNNFKDNIREIIEELLPDIIICVDLDFHPDHIMTSLCFEKAMGEILNKKENEYYPIVLKTFAYENSYLGDSDFNEINDIGMKCMIDENSRLINNLHYNFKDRIEIPIAKECYSRNLLKNPIWKAINAHKSQLLVKHAYSIINSNYVYWNRNTKNLIYKAKIEVTSSNGEYLHDFLLADTTNVLNGNNVKIMYDKAIWIPEKNDKRKEICISFEEKKYVKYMKIYMGLINEKYIKKVQIMLDGEKHIYRLDNENIQKILINDTIKEIVVKVLDDDCKNGFSEIELIETEEPQLQLDYIKGIIENSWTNNFMANNLETKEYNLKYAKGGKIATIVDDSNLKNGKHNEGKLFLNKNTVGYILLRNGENEDKIYINRYPILRKISIIINKLLIKLSIFYTKVYRKILIRSV